MRKQGYSVIWVTEFSPGISDIEVLELAEQHRALLITADKDFARMTFARCAYTITIQISIILLREFNLSDTLAQMLLDSIKTATEPPRNFIVIREDQIRIRNF